MTTSMDLLTTFCVTVASAGRLDPEYDPRVRLPIISPAGAPTESEHG